jgi:hypothetical protein
MGKTALFILFIITLLAGAFFYFAPKQPVVTPVGFMMDQSGYNSVETINHKRTQHLNMITKNGLIQIRRHMDDIAQEQNKFLDTIQYQQQVLENATKEASDIMRKAQEMSGNNNDILRLKDLTSQMQNDQLLLVANGKDLIALNDQITQSRQWLSDQTDLTKANTETSLDTLKQHYNALNHQASAFFHKVLRHDQEVRDRMNKIQGQLSDLVDNAANNGVLQQQNVKDRIQHMLEEEHENMLKLVDSEEGNRNLLRDEQDKLADSQDQLNDSLQRSRDLIDEEHQKAQDRQNR